MQSLFGLELSTAQKVIVASVVILILLALLGLIVRQIQGGRLRLRGQVAGRQRQPRLGVVDTYDLDRQRQLVLIRRDNIEHLVMIGGASDVVVETNIMRSGSRAAVPSYAETALPDRPLPPFETLVPPSEPAIRAGEELRRNGAPAPDVLPALPTRPVSPADFMPSAGPAVVQPGPVPAKPTPALAPVPSVASAPAPSFAREHAPQPPVSPGELDDMTRQLEEALKRPFSAVRPAHLPDEAPAELAVPPVKPATPAPVGQPPAAPPKPEPKPVPKVVPAAPHIPVMPAPARQGPLPGSVEAELAAALGLSPDHAAARSAEITAPPPKAPEPKGPEPKVPEVKVSEARPPEPKAVFAKPAEPRPMEPKPAEPKPVESRPAEPKPAPAALKPAPQPAPPPPPVVEPEPAPEPEPVKAEPESVSEAKPEPMPEPEKPATPDPKEIDPFSVDAIEAEFARLLGRDPKAKS